MSDIIHLLPDSVANQIAAGEVIQRPASVVKELSENAVDSGSTSIKINIKDAGKTLVQVIDNGYGMSETDARMAFERHSTSKIKDAKDLFAIRTMGFRGEALASVAAIANVELKTKRSEDELGTYINISGSKVICQEPVNVCQGSNFLVKNLFFNVPARRRFLKSDSTELKNIINEFQKIALSHQQIVFSLFHNGTEIYNLPPSNILQRIVHIFGKNINQNLIKVNTETSIITISGFIGKPEFARKTFGEQFFFVNNRYMRHPYFHKAIMHAYKKILPPETIPSYFIYFDADPNTIDINIHPTKTEIKFEDEQTIWQIIQASIKEALGKHNIVPSIDFNTEGIIDIPVIKKNTVINPPLIEIDQDFNPFNEEQKTFAQKGKIPSLDKENLTNWEKLYSGFENEKSQSIQLKRSRDDFQQTIGGENFLFSQNFFQLKNKYILVPVKSGLMLIDQKRAHERIMFETFIKSIKTNFGVAQQNLFPQTIKLSLNDHTLLMEIIDDICRLGFDIRDIGNNSVVINGCPADSGNSDPREMIEVLLEEYKIRQMDVKMDTKVKIAGSLAKASAINYGKTLINEEMREIVDKLFACDTPNFSPDGKPIISILQIEELEKRFK